MDECLPLFSQVLLDSASRRRRLIRDFYVRKNVIRSQSLAVLKAHFRNQTLVLQKLLDVHFKRNRSIRAKERSSKFWPYVCEEQHAERFYEAFRMKQESFDFLYEKVKTYTNHSEQLQYLTAPVPLKTQFAVCIYKLSTGADYRAVGDVFGIHKSTVHKFFHKILTAILALQKEVIFLPDEVDAQKIATSFKKNCSLPNVFGWIDSRHIAIETPRHGYEDYVNTNGYRSMILQSVIDDCCMFRDISIKYPGAARDIDVFKGSGLYGNANTVIPRCYVEMDNTDVPYVLVGDTGFPLMPWLITPFTGDILSPEEESFNSYMGTVRIRVETAFKRLKGRWHCLCGGMKVAPKIIPNVVAACIILHNFLEARSEGYLDGWNIADTANSQQPARMISHEVIVKDGCDPQNVRNSMKTYLVQNFPLRVRSFN